MAFFKKVFDWVFVSPPPAINSASYLFCRSVCASLLIKRRYAHVLSSLSCLLIADYSVRSVNDSWEPDTHLSSRNAFANSLELFFIVVFTVEACLKVIAMGFFLGDGSYLTDPWNWIDFVVVVSGYVIPCICSR